MKVTLSKTELTIVIPINKELKPSGSGKSLVVASTNGNFTTDVKVDGKPLIVGLNAYVKV